MSQERLRKRLQYLGLSSKEIDVYLAILDHGEAKVSRIVDAADVSQRHVYQMCERLDERGLVVLNDHVRPSVVRAKAADRAVGEISDRLESLESDISQRLEQPATSDLEVELIKSRQTLVDRWKQFVSAARRELFVCLPASAVSRFAADLSAAVERGVVVYLLVTDPGLDPFDRRTLAGHASVARTLPSEPAPLLSVDGHSTVSDDARLLIDEDAAGSAFLLARSPVAGNLSKMYLSNYWRLGDQEYLCDPDELPQSYEQLRSAAVNVVLHERQGRTLTATVRARSCQADEIVEMRDVPVVEVRQGLVEPFTNAAPIENHVCVSYEGDVVSVGAPGDPTGEYEALEITLDVADPADP